MMNKIIYSIEIATAILRRQLGSSVLLEFIDKAKAINSKPKLKIPKIGLSNKINPSNDKNNAIVDLRNEGSIKF